VKWEKCGEIEETGKEVAMADYLEQIDRIIAEHQMIKGHLKMGGDSTSDQEALITLKSARSEWTPQRVDIMSEKMNKLRQTIASLREGLLNHFQLEEDILPPILGKILIQALLRDHKEIMGKINEINSTIASARLEELSPDELATKDAGLSQMTASLSRLIEGHAEKEEQMLDMAKQVLQDEVTKSDQL
jgi:hemerythrin